MLLCVRAQLLRFVAARRSPQRQFVSGGDFFLWFNYAGDDSATDIVFVNAVDPDLALGDPVR